MNAGETHAPTSARVAGRLGLMLGALIPGCAWSQGIQVVDAGSRATPPRVEVGVAYFTIRNGGETDRLLHASSTVAKSAGLHVSQ